MSCAQCGCASDPGAANGRLLLAPPLGHTESKVRRGLREAGLDVATEDGLLSVEIDPDRFQRVSYVMDDVLTSEEARSTRAVLVDTDADPSPARLLRAFSWPELRARHEDRWLFEMLDEGRLDVHFQPIVRAEDPDRTAGYEALLRGRDAAGEVVPPGRLFRRAREAGLLFTLDREARMAAVRAAGEWIGDKRVFVNFNPASIYDPEYCLRTTVQAVGDADLSADQFVFEVVETEEVDRVDDLVDILDYYRDAGFSVALDDLGSGYASLSFLNRLQPDVVKLDMELIRDVDSIPYKAEVASQILELADRIGAESVAEGVESEEEWAWVRDHGATYASGFLFGRPAPGDRWADERGR